MMSPNHNELFQSRSSAAKLVLYCLASPPSPGSPQIIRSHPSPAAACSGAFVRRNCSYWQFLQEKTKPKQKKPRQKLRENREGFATLFSLQEEVLLHM